MPANIDLDRVPRRVTAQLFAEEGWSKARLRDAIMGKAKRPVRELKKTGGNSTKYWWADLVDPNDDDALVPAILSRQSLAILVSGGWPPPGSQCLFITSAHGVMVTRKIDLH